MKVNSSPEVSPTFLLHEVRREARSKGFLPTTSAAPLPAILLSPLTLAAAAVMYYLAAVSRASINVTVGTLRVWHIFVQSICWLND